MSRPRYAEPSRIARVPGLHHLLLALALVALAVDGTTPRAAHAAFNPVFGPPELFDVGAGMEPECIAAGDLNGDGLPDLVVGTAPAGIAVLIHYGTGAFPWPFRPAAIKTLGTDQVTGVKLADMNKDGKLDVVLTLRGQAVTVMLGDGMGNFGNPVSYFDGASVYGHFSVADVNGDGWPDVVLDNPPFGVDVLLGTGGGALAPSVSYAMGGLVGVEDVTGDGIADIVSQAEDSVTVWPGNPAGTFTSSLPPVSTGLNIVTDHAWSWAMGDLNGDSVPDLVYSWESNYSTQVNAAQHIGVLLGTGAGGFQAAASYPSSLPVAQGLIQLLLGDMDGNGTTDAVMFQQLVGTFSTIEVVKGSGTGTLGTGTLYGEPSQIAGAVLVDIDGDGKLDMAAALKVAGLTHYDGHCIAVARNDGNGGLVQPVISASSGTPTRSVVADFNRDGKPDLALADQSAFARIATGDGSGAFTMSSVTPLSNPVTSMTAGDLDLNGTPDLVTGDGIGGLHFLSGVGDGTVTGPNSIGGSTTYGTYPRSMADMNRDGLPDLVVTKPNGSVVVLTQIGGGGFQASPQQSFMNSPVNDLVLGDWNRDGYLDMAGVTAAGLGVMTGGPTGLHNAGTVGLGRNYSAVCAGDFNQDGILDLAARESADSLGAGRGVDVFLGDGTGAFTLAQSLHTLDPRGYTIEAADVNHDGKLDLVTQGVFYHSSEDEPPDAEAEVHLGHGDGTFDATPWADVLIGTTNPNYGPCTVTDVDRDETPDVIASIFTGPGVQTSTYHINSTSKGNGLISAAFYSTVSAPRSVAVGDLNRDGKLDVVTCTPKTAPGVTVHLGNGNGTLGVSQILASSGRANRVAIADFNRDGIPDIAALNDSVPPFGIATMLGTGNGTVFGTPANYFFNAGLDFKVGDVNRDGIPDIVVATPDSIRVLNGVGDGTFTGGSGVSLPSCSHLELADLNRDGYLDVICASGSVKVSYGGPTGLQPPVTVPGPITTCQTLCVGDFNRDGFPDIEANQGGQWYILWGAAISPFSTSAVSTLPFAPSAVTEGDAEANGVPYLYAAHPGQIDVLSVSPGGAIASVGSYTVGSQPGALALGDFNRDGGLDVVSASSADATLAINLHGTGPVTAVEATAATPPARASLLQNYPNPFNPRTTIRYALPRAERVRLAVFDVEGRLVATLQDGVQAAGDHAVSWDGRDRRAGAGVSGVYFCQLTTESGERESERMVLLK